MKKLIFLLSFIMVGFIATAQTTAVTKSLFKIPTTAYIYQYVGTASDSLGAVRDSILFPLYVESFNPTWYDFKVRIHEVVSPCNVAVQLQGRKFSTDSWSTITTTTYKGVGTDTSILFNQTTTLQHYNYYQLVFKRASNKAKITDITAIFKR